MASFSVASFAATCLIGAGVAIRLLLVWRRTRALPELALGVSTLGLALSPIALIVGSKLVSSAPGSAIGLFFIGVILHSINPTAMALGVWRIFRPDSRWAGFLFTLAAAALGVWMFRRLGAGEIALQTQDPITRAISDAARLGVFGWAAFECFRYRALLVRRERLGIGSPETAHRLALWGSSAIGIASIAVIGWWGNAVVDTPLLQWPAGLISISAIGLLSAATLSLAFFPPRIYRERVLRVES